jgi:hypothetical protein
VWKVKEVKGQGQEIGCEGENRKEKDRGGYYG